MMDSLVLAAGTALWLGVLTSISPCPLATNIAAISFIVRGMSSPGRVLATGVLYTLGRMLTYLILGALLVDFDHTLAEAVPVGGRQPGGGRRGVADLLRLPGESA